MRLTDRQPHLTANELIERFVPPHRFEDSRFDNYVPDLGHPSQAAAVQRMGAFARSMNEPARGRRFKFFGKSHSTADKPALYLDGGFGVGKTHLLASLWHEASTPKAYMTFTELTSFVGFAGMPNAIKAFEGYKLLCIDEFELDDIANTLMVVSFLRGTMSGGMRLAVTSNTLPDKLGEKRFSAQDFKREIAAIASYFDELRVDGDDFRTSHAPEPLRTQSSIGEGDSTQDEFDALAAHLTKVHPVQYGAMFDGVAAVAINNVHPIRDQDGALLWVQFIDKLYDARIPVSIRGCAVDEVFDRSYRSGGFRKKYGRAESRMQAMHMESRTETG